jgi:hypothetical protein
MEHLRAQQRNTQHRRPRSVRTAQAASFAPSPFNSPRSDNNTETRSISCGRPSKPPRARSSSCAVGWAAALSSPHVEQTRIPIVITEAGFAPAGSPPCSGHLGGGRTHDRRNAVRAEMLVFQRCQPSIRRLVDSIGTLLVHSRHPSCRCGFRKTTTSTGTAGSARTPQRRCITAPPRWSASNASRRWRPPPTPTRAFRPRRSHTPRLPDQVWISPPTGPNDPAHPRASQPEDGAAAIAPTSEHTGHPGDRHGADPTAASGALSEPRPRPQGSSTDASANVLPLQTRYRRSFTPDKTSG